MAYQKKPARAFIAVELPDRIKENIVSLNNKLKEEAIPFKPVSRENLHLTLKFLGRTPPGRMEKIKTVLDDLASGTERFSLSFRGVGSFPSPERPLILWAGAGDGNRAIFSLQRKIEEGLRKTGCETENRAYHPHVTIARLKKGLNSGGRKIIGEWLEKNRDADFGKLDVRSLSLFRSELSAEGAAHTLIAAFDFAESRP